MCPARISFIFAIVMVTRYPFSLFILYRGNSVSVRKTKVGPKVLEVIGVNFDLIYEYNNVQLISSALDLIATALPKNILDYF